MAMRDEVAVDLVERINLMEITLTSCKGCEEIPMLGHLLHLKYLYLSDLENVRSIDSSFYGVNNCGSNNKTIIVFPALKMLKLLDFPNLIEWAEVEVSSVPETQTREVKVFPCLEYLEIKNCKELMSAPSHFPCLQELCVSGINSDLPLANICGIKLPSLTKLKVQFMESVKLSDGLFYNIQNLSVLEIQWCPNLIELPNGLHTLNSLQELRILMCPNLKSIPYGCSSGGQSQGLTLLRSLGICYCRKLINFPACEMLHSCAPSLEKLSLWRLSSRSTNLAMVIDSLQNMPRLTKLEIVINVPQFSLTPMGINLRNILRSLQELRMGPCPDSSDCDSFKKTFDWILQECHSLRILWMEDWDSPDHLQHLTTLYSLVLNNVGIETLPEWLGNLPSLETPRLGGCKKLRCMPSKKAMQRLTKLNYLFIGQCPLLKERCIEQRNDDNSEWPNISHIPYVCVDGDRQIPSRLH